jgi:hypothetical protein
MLSILVRVCLRKGGPQAMQGKITKTSVDRLETWTVLWDSDVKGFGVRRHGADS